MSQTRHSAAELLRRARSQLNSAGVESAALDARVLLCHITGWTQEFVLAHPEAELSLPLVGEYEALIARRMLHEPIAYICGYREFWGRDFAVNEETLIPRPDTEALIELLLGHYPTDGEAPESVLELGIGTGCILISLLCAWSDAYGVGIDCAKGAVQAAQKNAKTHRVHDRATLYVSHWDSAIPDTEHFDVLVSNPPYITLADHRALQPGVRDYEPEMALVAGHDGLDAYRAIATLADARVSKKGVVALEVGYEQAPAVKEIFTAHGWHCKKTQPDLAGIDRALLFTRVDVNASAHCM